MWCVLQVYMNPMILIVDFAYLSTFDLSMQAHWKLMYLHERSGRDQVSSKFVFV